MQRYGFGNLEIKPAGQDESEAMLVITGTDLVIGKAVVKSASALEFDLQLFAKKSDIKQIESIGKEFKMTSDQRRGFGDYIESLKDLVPNNKNFSYQKLRELAKEYLGVD